MMSSSGPTLGVRAESLPTTRVDRVEDLVALSVSGLPAMHVAGDASRFAHTREFVSGSIPRQLSPLGHNARYDAIVLLGASLLEDAGQRSILGGASATEYAATLVTRQREGTDLGAVALTVWASAEAGVHPGPALDRMHELLKVTDGRLVVPTAWALTALVAVIEDPRSARAIDRERGRLLRSRFAHRYSFPHWTIPMTGPWLRHHVGCFADQVYPIQALARLHAAVGDPAALEAAEAAARVICELQGDAGQWWWHYDTRRDAVLEGYPVYSVHQHAMAPMALFELAEAGGTDRSGEIVRGLDWLWDRPETAEEMIRPDLGLVWRKVGRNEPRPKVVRAAKSAATAVNSRFQLSLLDKAFPPGRVDQECRPYELGWLLYAWLARRSGAPRRLQGSESDG